MKWPTRIKGRLWRAARPARQVAACRRLRCEQLESRSLLSVTITGTVTGTYTAAAYDFECGGQVDMPSSVSTGTDVTVGGGTTLDLGNEPFAVGTLTLLDGSVVDGSLSAGAYDLQNGTLSASLGGDGGVTVGSGATGTVTLSGANSYGGRAKGMWCGRPHDGIAAGGGATTAPAGAGR